MEKLAISRLINRNQIKQLNEYLGLKYKKPVFIVEILETQKDIHIKKGQWFIAENYCLDPREKVTLIDRVSRNGRVFQKKPSYNQYKSEIKQVGIS